VICLSSLQFVERVSNYPYLHESFHSPFAFFQVLLTFKDFIGIPLISHFAALSSQHAFPIFAFFTSIMNPSYNLLLVFTWLGG